MRAGSLKARRETYAATPAPAPVDVVFGLGGRPSVDAVRVLWPAGIVQAELSPAVARALVVNELDRKPSSCPFLFAWNGERFEFVTDFLGGGELGYWQGPGVRSHPDPDEYVRIPGEALRARDGLYELRITNELEEVLYLDHVRLDAIAHPKHPDHEEVLEWFDSPIDPEAFEAQAINRNFHGGWGPTSFTKAASVIAASERREVSRT